MNAMTWESTTDITKPVIKARLTSSIESHLKNLNKNQI